MLIINIMKKTFLVFLFTLLLFSNAYSQDTANEKTAIHNVALGETVVLIAKKYMVLPQDIYEFNPDAAQGVTAGMALKIPVERKINVAEQKKKKDVTAAHVEEAKKSNDTVVEIAKETQADPAEDKKLQNISVLDMVTVPVAAPTHVETTKVNHEVQSGETLTGLARKYNTTVSAIVKANGNKVKSGLEIGQEVVIPDAIPDEVLNSMVTHHVQSGETLNALARKYNTTVDEITIANHTILKRGLQAGQTLKILPGTTAAQEVAQNAVTPVSAPTQAEEAHSAFSVEAAMQAGVQVTVNHEVQSGETLTGLARKYNTTIEAITAANEKKLKKGLQVGQVLSITSNTGER